MQVRRYKASTIHDAVNLVKQELGPEALILSTRKMREEKKAPSYKTQEFFEITAVPGGSHKAKGPFSSTGQASTDERDHGFLGSLKSELMSIKEMIFLLSSSGKLAEGFRLNPGAIEVYGRLIRSGIAEPYAQLFLERGGAFKKSGERHSKDLHVRVFKEVMKVIEVTDPFSHDRGQVILALIGPTGVGKTTTIAKLAANLSLKQKKSAGLAAVDQLKTYAGILGIPCFAAFNRAELEFALRRMKEKDVILMDTAGHGHYDVERIEGLKELIGSYIPVRTHLVLSTVTNELEMERAAKNFGRLKFSSYIFTKIDETQARGVIINQLFRLRMPVSFITTGQRVPEDIFKATKTGILRLLFNHGES